MNEVKTYVKKPIPIKALQYTGDNREEILEFTNGQAIFRDVVGMKELVIHTLEGDMIAVPGSYIACGPANPPDYYPVREDIFEMTYEEVGDDGEKNS